MMARPCVGSIDDPEAQDQPPHGERQQTRGRQRRREGKPEDSHKDSARGPSPEGDGGIAAPLTRDIRNETITDVSSGCSGLVVGRTVLWKLEVRRVPAGNPSAGSNLVRNNGTAGHRACSVVVRGVTPRGRSSPKAGKGCRNTPSTSSVTATSQVPRRKPSPSGGGGCHGRSHFLSAEKPHFLGQPVAQRPRRVAEILRSLVVWECLMLV